MDENILEGEHEYAPDLLTPEIQLEEARPDCCKQNTNNVDLLIALGHDYRSAVALLEQ